MNQRTLTELDRIRVRLAALERIEPLIAEMNLILENLRDEANEAVTEPAIRAPRRGRRPKQPVGASAPAAEPTGILLNADGTPRKRRGRPPGVKNRQIQQAPPSDESDESDNASHANGETDNEGLEEVTA